MSKTILVCGGAGFIGAHFIDFVLTYRPSWKVLNYDLLTYAAPKDAPLKHLHNPRYSFVIGDICDKEKLAALVERYAVDYIVNFAAETHVCNSISDPAPFVRTNVTGVATLLDLMRTYPIERMLQVSTDEVLGELEEGAAPWKEDAPLDPRNPYSATKASAETLVRSAVHTYGLDCVITRCTNNYGPRQFPEKLVPAVVTTASKNRRVPMFGDGSSKRDWLHVSDHAEGICKALEQGRKGETYHFSAYNEKTTKEVISDILEILRKSDRLIDAKAPRSGEDKRYSLDHTKAAEELEWKPRISYSAGLKATVLSYL